MAEHGAGPLDVRLPTFVSRAFDGVPHPDYADVAVVALPSRAPTDPEWWARQIFDVAGSPRWVRGAFALRQALVGLIGIDRGSPSVFDVREVVGEEALIVAPEKHLDFHVGVGVDAAGGFVRVTTVVRLHGWRGRVYFAPVRLLHGPVVHAMLGRAARRAAR